MNENDTSTGPAEAVDEISTASSIGVRSFAMLFAIVALTLPAVYVHGYVLHRWGDHEQLVEQAKALSQLPQQFGQWRHVADGKPIAPYLQEQLELRGYLHRVYEHNATGQRVSVLLLVGPSGPLVRHPPEICYRARANRLLESRPLVVNSGLRRARLKLLRYESNQSYEADFFVAYAFGVSGNWNVPSSPRRAYAGKPVLYKLHALTDAANEMSESTPQGLIEFLSEFLPAVNQTTVQALEDSSDADESIAEKQAE